MKSLSDYEVISRVAIRGPDGERKEKYLDDLTPTEREQVHKNQKKYLEAAGFQVKENE